MKYKLTAQQRANLIEAQAVWRTVPHWNVSRRLCRFTDGDHDRTDCGTVACGGGWLARWPRFRKQGLRIDGDGFPVWRNRAWGLDAAKAMFGDEDLFTPRGQHIADGRDRFKSDHACFANRLRYILENAE